MATKRRARSAVTGTYVSNEAAAANPRETVIETRRAPLTDAELEQLAAEYLASIPPVVLLATTACDHFKAGYRKAENRTS